MKHICDNNPILEFLSKSKIDDGLIYKINLPSGYTIVPPINELI